MTDEQLDFFGGSTPLEHLAAQPREARAGDRRGSLEAAKVPDKPERFVALLAQASVRIDFTDDELAIAMPEVHPGTLSKRRLRLERAGLIEDTKRLRPTRTGVPATVFQITDQGREVLTTWRT